MSEPKEDKIDSTVLGSTEYLYLRNSIDQLHSALIVIQSGIYDEINQVNSLNKMIKAQDDIILYYQSESIVNMDYVKKAIKDRKVLQQVADHKANVIKSLNSYLTERMGQMDLLNRKMKELLYPNTSNVLQFRGSNGKD